MNRYLIVDTSYSLSLNITTRGKEKKIVFYPFWQTIWIHAHEFQISRCSLDSADSPCFELEFQYSEVLHNFLFHWKYSTCFMNVCGGF